MSNVGCCLAIVSWCLFVAAGWFGLLLSLCLY